MNRAKSLLLVTATIACLLISAAAYSQQEIVRSAPSYTLGEQTLSINGGLLVPLFFQSADFGVHATNLVPGGAGSLLWQSYLNNNVTLGVEIGGMFAFSKPTFPNLLLMLPITVRGAYILRHYPFEFPVYMGAGLNIVRYLELTHFDLALKPGVSAFWVYDSTWSFGVNLVYWWILQLVLGDQFDEKTRIGNFLEISLSALYHF